MSNVSYAPIPALYRARNGNQCIIFVGATPIAFAEAFDFTIDYGAQQVYGIGSEKPQDLQQLKFAPRFSLRSIELTTQGQLLVGSGQANLRNYLGNNYFNVGVFTADDSIIDLTFLMAMATSVRTTIPANGLVTDTFDCLAMDVINELGQSLAGNPLLTNALGTPSVAVGVGEAAAGIATAAGLAATPGLGAVVI
jgi:hypothetical protein